SLAEIAPAAGQASPCEPHVLQACAAFDDRLAAEGADKRAPAFEACLRLATRASLGPMPWEQLRVIAASLERPPIGVELFQDAQVSIFPRRVDDEIAASDRRATPLDRAPLDELVAQDPRELGSAVWRTEQAPGSQSAGALVATFLADL